MAGAVEELAKKLRVPCHHYNRMERVLKQHKEAHTGEHHLMQGILTVLSGRHGPYFLLASMDSRHRRGLLIHMGQDASGLNYKQVERAIMCAWADQVRARMCSSIPQCCLTCIALQVDAQHCAAMRPCIFHKNGLMRASWCLNADTISVLMQRA